MLDITELENDKTLFNLIREVKLEKCSIKRKEKASIIKRFFKSYSADISAFSKFSDIPNFPHRYFGIFISQGASIGKGCTIFQHVTIGSNMLVDSSSIGYPTIGDNCYIGAGAKIIGNCRIGNNVRVGANAVVYKNVPDNCIVTGTEMKILHKKDMDNRYFSYDIENGWAYKLNGEWMRDLEPNILDKLKSMNGD